MEGRPPFDPDEDLDFDFESSRRRRYERDRGTGERPIPGEAGEEPDAQSPDEDSTDTSERKRSRREGPSSGTMKLPGLGARRKRKRDRNRERERPAPATTAATDTGEQRRLRDDPFTPAEVPVPGDRRAHRRDLPANVRRRQAIAIGLGVLVLGVGVYVLASSLFGGGDEEGPTPVKRLVGQTVIGKLGKSAPDNKLLRRVRKGQVGGFIVEPRNAEALTRQTEALNAAAEEGDNPPLLFVIDQEGGDVKRLPGPPTISPQSLAEGGDPGAAQSQGEETGTFLRELGVNVDLAPVMDVSLPRTAESIGDRTFGEDPQVVSDLGSAFIDGLQSQDVAATAKHFPGLGTATVNTDDSPVTIAATQEDLDAALIPFQGAVEAGVDLMMVSSASYPRLGADKPAVFAKPIIQTLLRDDLGFEGVVISDDLQSGAISAQTGAAGVEAVSALGAGVDLLLYASTDAGSVAGFNAVVKAVKAGEITREQLEETTDRIADLKSSLG